MIVSSATETTIRIAVPPNEIPRLVFEINIGTTVINIGRIAINPKNIEPNPETYFSMLDRYQL